MSPPSETLLREVQARIHIEACFPSKEIPAYCQLTPVEESALRNEFQDRFHGGKSAEFLALVRSAAWNPLLPNTDGSGHPGLARIRAALESALAAYNSIEGGFALALESSDPSGVRYELRGDETTIVYGSPLLITKNLEGMPDGPPDGVLRIVLQYVVPTLV